MPISKIDALMKAMQEDYMRNVFADRLESARLAVDDPTFGDSAETAEALGAFMSLTPQERIYELNRVRILGTVLNWTNNEEVTVADINSIITALRSERDKKQATPDPEPDPEPEPELSGEGDGE